MTVEVTLRPWAQRLAKRIRDYFGPGSFEFCEPLRYVDESGYVKFLALLHRYGRENDVNGVALHHITVTRHLMRMSDAGVTPEALEHLLRLAFESLIAAQRRVLIDCYTQEVA